jgi:ParB family chromosome partitioning protein
MQTVPLSQLAIASINVRKTNSGAEPKFAASIRAKGVIEPLTVRKNGNGYTITNGGKRFAALTFLRDNNQEAKGERVTDSYPVPVNIRDESDAEARDTSLTTNIVRSDMHPVDLHKAFVDLITDGKTEKDLAAEYLMTDREVKQVLALGALSSKVLEAWKAGKFGAKVAEAFTLAESHKLQDKALDVVLKDKTELDLIEEPITADEVKDQFKLSPSAIGGMVEFVGVDELGKYGVKVTRDLFGTDHTVSNEKKVKELATEKANQACEDLVRSGWAWAVLENTVRDSYSYGRARGEEVKPTPAELATLAELKAKSEAIEHYGRNRFSDQAEALENEITARGFSEKQKEKAGCFVSLSTDGVLIIDYGRVKPQEAKAAAAIEKASKKVAAPKSSAEKKPNLTISNNLIAKLSQQLTAAAAEAIATNPAAALPAIVAGFASASHAKVIDVSQDRYRHKQSFAAVFETTAKLKPAEQLAALAQRASLLVNMNVSHSDRGPLRDAGSSALCEALGAPLYAALKKHFDAKDYFSSVNEHICRQKLKEMFGSAYQAKWDTEKKAPLEKIAVTKAKETGWLPPELRTSFYKGPGSASDKKTAKLKKAA